MLHLRLNCLLLLIADHLGPILVIKHPIDIASVFLNLGSNKLAIVLERGRHSIVLARRGHSLPCVQVAINGLLSGEVGAGSTYLAQLSLDVLFGKLRRRLGGIQLLLRSLLIGHLAGLLWIQLVLEVHLLARMCADLGLILLLGVLD